MRKKGVNPCHVYAGGRGGGDPWVVYLVHKNYSTILFQGLLH